MLRQTEWRLQNAPIKNSGVFPVTTYFFWKICSVLDPLKKSQFDVPATQMSILVFFVSAGV